MSGDQTAPSTDGIDNPFIDTTDMLPKTVDGYRISGRCYGSSETGGECEAMELSFGSTDEWREHRDRHHPVSCDRCDIPAAYKRDNSPTSYCFKHIPDNPETVFAWHRTNTESIVEPPKAADDHPIEQALPEADRSGGSK